jgi:hypothetical protein
VVMKGGESNGIVAKKRFDFRLPTPSVNGQGIVSQQRVSFRIPVPLQSTGKSFPSVF